MRLVLLVIGSYVRRRGSIECWPSVRALEAATRLSQRCIIDQIEGAVLMGWLLKRLAKVGDMQRPGNVYTLTMPTAEARSAVTAEGRSAVPHRRPLNLTQPTAEPDSDRLLNVVPPLITSEVRNEIKDFEVGESKGNGKGPLQEERHDDDILSLKARALGLTRNNGETRGAFAVRVAQAEVAKCN